MKLKLTYLIAAIVSSAALAQELTQEQAMQKLRLRSEQRSVAATQPATREELGDLWSEVDKMQGEIRGLRQELAQLRKMTEQHADKSAGSANGPAALTTPARGGAPGPHPVDANAN